MPIPLSDRLRNAWNAFRDRDPTTMSKATTFGTSYSIRPDLFRLRMGTSRSIAAPLYNRIAIDVASIPIQHVRLDQNGRYSETIDSGLNNCLTLDTNADQTGRSFMQDIVMSMFDEGVVCIAPIDTTENPEVSSSWDVQTMRTGRIVQWYPYNVLVNAYNERTGIKEDVLFEKKDVAIVENPLYAVMNEPNSTLKRLIYKLNLLDAVDEQSSSGKLDLIIQLPYVIKTETRKAEAKAKRDELETQLSGSKYGVGYIDATEKITQLNRPAENNLMKQVEYLTSMLYSQLGLSENIFNGTADEKEMLNYYARTIDPILSAITDEMIRKFLTKKARSQGQTIKYFKNAFTFVPFSQIGSLMDSLTRNAVLSSNEGRDIIGYKPSDNPEADQLRNKNLNPPSNSSQPDSSSNLSIEKGATTNGESES